MIKHKDNDKNATIGMNNKHMIDMASAFGIPESTLRRIWQQADNLHEPFGSAARTASRNTDSIVLFTV
jgi:hypothetical protein